MNQLPIFLNVRGRRGLVVGGGRVAARKATLLAKTGANVDVVAPELGDAMQVLVNETKVRHLQSVFMPEHLAGASVVFAATGDPQVNFAVSKAARERVATGTRA